jgi:hypothetical protein
MRIVLIATFLFGIISCENKNGNKPTIPTDTVVIKEEKPKEHMVGGPCTYRTDTLPARLIKLEPSGKQYNAATVARILLATILPTTNILLPQQKSS